MTPMTPQQAREFRALDARATKIVQSALQGVLACPGIDRALLARLLYATWVNAQIRRDLVVGGHAEKSFEEFPGLRLPAADSPAKTHGCQVIMIDSFRARTERRVSA